MGKHTPLSDEDLTAWLDGEAGPDLAAQIEAARAEPEVVARIAELEAGGAIARAMFDGTLQAAPRFEMPNATPGMSPWVGGAMGLAAGLVLAFGIGWGLSGSSAEPWHKEVAAYHALYVTQTLGSGPLPGAQAKLDTLSERVGRDLSQLPQADGLTFVRAQELGFEGKTLIQMAFLTDDGVPVALCVLRKDGDAAAMDRMDIADLASASWADETHRFILIGGQSDAKIARWAELFSTAL